MAFCGGIVATGKKQSNSQSLWHTNWHVAHVRGHDMTFDRRKNLEMHIVFG